MNRLAVLIPPWDLSRLSLQSYFSCHTFVELIETERRFKCRQLFCRTGFDSKRTLIVLRTLKKPDSNEFVERRASVFGERVSVSSSSQNRTGTWLPRATSRRISSVCADPRSAKSVSSTTSGVCFRFTFVSNLLRVTGYSADDSEAEASFPFESLPSVPRWPSS